MTRPAPAIKLEVLPAGYGDCLLVTCQVGGGRKRREWRLLVDTGPDECWPPLKERLAMIPPQPDGVRVIDLLVISHIDHDHIGGARLLLEDRELNLQFGDIWFNAPLVKPKPGRVGGVLEGHTLAKLLRAADSTRRPWNSAFGGQHAVTGHIGSFRDVPLGEGLPRITLLSPDPPRLDALFRVWDREIERLLRGERNERVERARTGSSLGLDVDALASRVTALDRAAPNGSSIAFLLEHRGASVLLAADAFAQVLGPAIAALAGDRRQHTQERGIGAATLKVDVLKLSHHGSRANTTLDLLNAVQADHYVVSTNGAIFRHPNDEVLARVIKRGGEHPTIWFNHDVTALGERIARWTDPRTTSDHGFGVELPGIGESGLILHVTGGRVTKAKSPVRTIEGNAR